MAANGVSVLPSLRDGPRVMEGAARADEIRLSECSTRESSEIPAAKGARRDGNPDGKGPQRDGALTARDPRRRPRSGRRAGALAPVRLIEPRPYEHGRERPAVSGGHSVAGM